MANNKITVARDEANRLLDREHSAQVLRQILPELKAATPRLLARLLAIAEEGDPKSAIKAIELITNLLCLRKVHEEILGFTTTKGRPANEEGPEAEARRNRWAKVVDMSETAPGSGTYQEAGDAPEEADPD